MARTTVDEQIADLGVWIEEHTTAASREAGLAAAFAEFDRIERLQTELLNVTPGTIEAYQLQEELDRLTD